MQASFVPQLKIWLISIIFQICEEHQPMSDETLRVWQVRMWWKGSEIILNNDARFLKLNIICDYLHLRRSWQEWLIETVGLAQCLDLWMVETHGLPWLGSTETSTCHSMTKDMQVKQLGGRGITPRQPEMGATLPHQDIVIATQMLVEVLLDPVEHGDSPLIEVKEATGPLETEANVATADHSQGKGFRGATVGHSQVPQQPMGLQRTLPRLIHTLLKGREASTRAILGRCEYHVPLSPAAPGAMFSLPLESCHTLYGQPFLVIKCFAGFWVPASVAWVDCHIRNRSPAS